MAKYDESERQKRQGIYDATKTGQSYRTHKQIYDANMSRNGAAIADWDNRMHRGTGDLFYDNRGKTPAWDEAGGNDQGQQRYDRMHQLGLDPSLKWGDQ